MYLYWRLSNKILINEHHNSKWLWFHFYLILSLLRHLPYKSKWMTCYYGNKWIYTILSELLLKNNNNIQEFNRAVIKTSSLSSVIIISDWLVFINICIILWHAAIFLKIVHPAFNATYRHAVFPLLADLFSISSSLCRRELRTIQDPEVWLLDAGHGRQLTQPANDHPHHVLLYYTLRHRVTISMTTY